MDLEHLDNKIPQRWLLLVCYYLPLCNLYSLYTPSSTFYFQCRQFINGLKSKRQKKISLVQLPDLLYLLKKYAIEETEQKLANEIVLDILTTDSECFTKEHIRVLFEKFDPNDRNGYISLLNRVFNHIPSHVYTDYLLSLIPNNCTLRHLKWCERLKNKFEFEDRFTLILSLPDNKLVAYQSIFSSLIREECEQRFLNCSLEAHLNDPLIEPLLDFIFLCQPDLLFSFTFIESFLFQCLKNQDPRFISRILKLELKEQFIFFEKFLISEKFQENISYFFSLCFKKLPHASARIDYFILSAFNFQKTVQKETLQKKEFIQNNWMFLLLTQFENVDYSLSLFQWFAIHALTQKSLNLNKLKLLFNTEPSLQYSSDFSFDCITFIVDTSILSIKTYIKDNYMVHVPKENTRHSIHRTFLKFFNDDYLESSLDISKLILKKLPLDLQASAESHLTLLQQVLSEFYRLTNDPAFKTYKNKQLIEWNKTQRDEEEKIEGRRELLKRIQTGVQDSVSYQRMQELFDAKASTVQEKWRKSFGIHFFDANDSKERQLALEDAAKIIALKREFDDFSTLSISPTIEASSFR